jgi:acetyl esterase
VPVDPTFQTMLDGLGGVDAPDLADLTIDEARQLSTGLGALAGDVEHVDRVTDRTIPGPDGDVPVRIYRPAGDGSTPGILLWFHGGGWVLGDLDSTDPIARRLANASGVMVVSVAYRLAPEHSFPAGLHDCWAALQWVAEHGAELGGDASRLAVSGDSAGGNLAAAVAIMARDAGGPALRHQMLLYPITDCTMSSSSMDENGRGYMLTRRTMQWFTDFYLGADGDAKDPLASPLHLDDLRGLAPATVLTAGYDPLRDEGQAYAEALGGAGVPTRTRHYDSMIHGFLSMGSVSPMANLALDDLANTMRSELAS